jgi:Concanavalin A-like lectin/glucanases superfamily
VSISGDKAVVGPGVLPLNTWSHLAMTYNGATMRLYVNGVLVSSRAQTGNTVVSAGAVQIGGNTVWGEFFSGAIDEVRIYKRALSATEIQADMNTRIKP